MNHNSSQSYSSSSAAAANQLPAAWRPQAVGQVSWRILVIAAGYVLASMVAALLLGREIVLEGLGISLLSGILVGVTLAPIAARVSASRLGHWIVWGSALFLNELSVAIEGAFFAPTLSPIASMPVAWTVYLLFQSFVTGGLITWLFCKGAQAVAVRPRRGRPWYSWTWRFLVSAFSYLLFYFIFGAINYALVTRPFYAAHVSGLAVPPPHTVLLAELVRAPLIVLSIVPLVLLWNGKRTALALSCGIILFIIGGVIPLLLNIALPDPLRVASAIEIFFQNLLTGCVASVLLGNVRRPDLANDEFRQNRFPV